MSNIINRGDPLTVSIGPSLAMGDLAAFPLWVLVVVVVVGVAVLTLDVVALVDLYRRPVARVALGNKWVWVAIVVLVNLVGSVLYFAVGRKHAPRAEEAALPHSQRGNAESVADALYGSRKNTESE
jgi:NADH:ubiquinone oxidoreductase subunit 6 (subunit J)